MARVKRYSIKIVLGICLGYVFYRSTLMMFIFSLILIGIPNKEKKSQDGL